MTPKAALSPAPPEPEPGNPAVPRPTLADLPDPATLTTPELHRQAVALLLAELRAELDRLVQRHGESELTGPRAAVDVLGLLAAEVRTLRQEVEELRGHVDVLLGVRDARRLHDLVDGLGTGDDRDA